MSNCMTTPFTNSRRLSECCQNTIRWFQPSEPTTLHTPMRRRRTDSCGLEGNVFPWAALLRKTAGTGSPFQYSWNCGWFWMNSHRHCIITHRRSWDITLLLSFILKSRSTLIAHELTILSNSLSQSLIGIEEPSDHTHQHSFLLMLRRFPKFDYINGNFVPWLHGNIESTILITE